MLQRCSKKVICRVCHSPDSSGCSFDPLSHIHLCRKRDADVDGFIFTGLKSVWGVFLPRDKGYTITNPAERAERKRIITEQNLDNREMFRKEDINAAIELLQMDVLLEESHRRELLRRGLTDADIKGEFVSLQKGRVYEDVRGLTGFDREGRYYGASGILCPIYDYKGNYVGYQVRTANKDAKYVWTTTLGTTSAKIKGYGELPISCLVEDETKGKPLFLVDGILKAYITYKRHKINVCGASGGMFFTSPIQLQEIIDELKPSAVIFLPDAGDGLNTDVFRTLSRTADLITRNTSLKVQYGDWGQLYTSKKQNLDIDEIEPKVVNQRMVLYDFQYFKVDTEIDFQRLSEYVRELLNEGLLKGDNQDRICKGSYFPAPIQKVVPPEYNHTNYYYEPRRHEDILAQAYNLGYKYVLDNSPTGSGKSYRVGKFTPDNFKRSEADTRFFYFSQQHRLPTTTTLEENFAQMPTRNTEMYADPFKRTPLGKRVLKRNCSNDPDLDEEVVLGNCHQSNIFENYYAANLPYSANSICKECTYRDFCELETVPGVYGYLGEKAEVLANNRAIRAHINGISYQNINPTDIAFIDEYNQTLKFNKSIEVTTGDYLSVKQNLTNLLGDAHPEIMRRLDYIFTSSLQDLPTFGLVGGEYLRTQPAYHPDITTVKKVAKKEIAVNLERIQNRQIPLKMWQADAIRAVCGDPCYSFVVKAKQNAVSLQIIKKNEELVGDPLGVSPAPGLLSCFGMLVFMDATASKDMLALQLGVRPEEILCISTFTTPPANVRIRQIASLGALNKKRSKKQAQGVIKLRQALTQLYGKENIGFVDWKQWGKGSDLKHFVDARGSNAYARKKAVCCFGSANTNVGVAKAEFEIYSGRREGMDASFDELFYSYYEHLKQAEIEQTIGRLRANRRGKEELDFIFVSNLNVEFLRKRGFQYQRLNTCTICPEIATPFEKVILLLAELIRDKQTVKVSLKELAAAMGCSKSNISQLIRRNHQILGVSSYDEFRDSIVRQYLNKECLEQILAGMPLPERLSALNQTEDFVFL
jgi:predicted DNA-binding protein YlxM (UPF0122 family)